VHAFKEGGPVDWGFGEALAFGTLLLESIPVRLSGQDCEREPLAIATPCSTISRHAKNMCPLQHLDEKQERFCVYNSLLSEAAVLGFDYGYSARLPPDALPLGGAVRRLRQRGPSRDRSVHRQLRIEMAAHTGIVLLLPHGYEGQGPNTPRPAPRGFFKPVPRTTSRVANLTTPAQLFTRCDAQMTATSGNPLII